MSWTNDSQARLNYLRNQELVGTLTEPELVDLAALMAEVEAEEVRVLAPAVERLRAEVHGLEREIAGVQDANEEIARLLARQQALAADGQRFLAEFDQRRASILDGFARLASTSSPTT